MVAAVASVGLADQESTVKKRGEPTAGRKLDPEILLML